MGEVIGINPADGSELRVLEATDRAEVKQRVERARGAFESWGRLTIEERLRYLVRLRQVMAERTEEIATAISQATGKVDLEALTGDVLSTLMMIRYLEKNAATALKSEERRGAALFLGSSFRVEYYPYGVVAVFGPWNYPLHLAVVPMITALAAGNTVVLKASEVTPTIGELIDELFAQAGFPPDVVSVVQGAKAVGQALIDARPDRIFFTGSVNAGKAIMRRAAEHLIPVDLELGGKDPMIVLADAPFERAVHGAVYGAFANAGQLCVSVERCYVQKEIYERFVAAVTREAKKIRVGSGRNADIGPLIDAAQKKTVADHINDAKQKGAKITTEIVRKGAYYHPVVLRDVNHSMRVMQEETFGPVLPVMPFDRESDAIRLANDSPYGLNASIWSADRRKAQRVAAKLVVGSCAINNVVLNISNPSTPFGGEKMSGFGRYHGPEGLRTMSRTRTVMTSSARLKKEINWFPFRPSGYKAVQTIIKAAYGSNQPLRLAEKVVEKIIALTRKAQ